MIELGEVIGELRRWTQAAQVAQTIPDAASQAQARSLILTALADAEVAEHVDLARQLAATVLTGLHWPVAVRPIGLLDAADAVAIGEALLAAVRPPGG